MKTIIIAGAIVTLGALGLVIAKSADNKPQDNKSTASSSSTRASDKGKKACELITLADAKSLIGANATLAEGSGSPDLATTDAITVDNCTYSADGATLGDLKQLTIQSSFGDAKQVKLAYDNYRQQYPGESLADLSPEAYYATELKHLNVLKGQYWLFVFGGSINDGDSINKELHLKAARLALQKL